MQPFLKPHIILNIPILRSACLNLAATHSPPVSPPMSPRAASHPHSSSSSPRSPLTSPPSNNNNRLFSTNSTPNLLLSAAPHLNSSGSNSSGGNPSSLTQLQTSSTPCLFSPNLPRHFSTSTGGSSRSSPATTATLALDKLKPARAFASSSASHSGPGVPKRGSTRLSSSSDKLPLSRTFTTDAGDDGLDQLLADHDAGVHYEDDELPEPENLPQLLKHIKELREQLKAKPAPAKKPVIRTSQELPALQLAQLPSLSNFGAAKKFFTEKILAGNKELDSVWVAPEATAEAYRQIFPELVDSRGTTKLEEADFSLWDDPASNRISVEVDPGDQAQPAHEHVDLLAVGGPSALTGALLHKVRHPGAKTVYGVTGRQDSNHDGSAYYFHERDAFPVYINRVNRGPYCIYADVRKRLLPRAKLVDECVNNRHHVKISMNWPSITLKKLLHIFVPNVWHMLKDVYLLDPKKTLMRHTVEHAKTTHDILDTVCRATGLPKQAFLMQGKDRACYVGFQGGTSPEQHFTWLNQYTDIPFHTIEHRGVFGDEVQQVVAFPRDGLINPWIIDNLKALLADGQPNAAVRHNFQLKKLLVKRDPGQPDRPRVTKVVWQDTATGQTRVTSVGELLLSLGPSAQLHVDLPAYSLKQHARDVWNAYKAALTGQPPAKPADSSAAPYPARLRSLVRHLLSRGAAKAHDGQVFKEFMWAAGSSNVMMIAVDLAKTTPAKLELYRKFMDGVNQHWTPIAEREVVVAGGKRYKYFAIQMTGGGNFPSRKITPDYVLNLIHTTEKMLGLDKDPAVVSYDLVQTRGCGRGVSAKNSVAFAPLATNAVANYALGGIGMTTMFPNGELMVQLLEALKAGKSSATVRPLVERLAQGSVGSQHSLDRLHAGKNVFKGIDYTTLVDDERTVARLIGFDETLPVVDRIISFKTKLLSYMSSLLPKDVSVKESLAQKQQHH